MILIIAAQTHAGNPVYSKRIRTQAAAITNNPITVSTTAIPNQAAALRILPISY
jgi:hypothetical protein